jgi:hypothetical protein
MSDTANGAKAVKTKTAGQGWTAAPDGASIAKTYKLDSAGEAVKLAKRALQLAEKGGLSVKIGYSGSEVSIGLVAAGGKVADAERRLAKRLDGGKGAVADKAPKAPKPDKAAKRAAKAAKIAKAPPGSDA